MEQGDQLCRRVNYTAAAHLCLLPSPPALLCSPAAWHSLGCAVLLVKPSHSWWVGEGKGKVNLLLGFALQSCQLRFCHPCSASMSSAGAFSKTFAVVPSMGWRGRELRRSEQLLLRSISGLTCEVGAGACQDPVTANVFYCSFFAASEKQGGIRLCSLWYELCLLVLLTALLRIC